MKTKLLKKIRKRVSIDQCLDTKLYRVTKHWPLTERRWFKSLKDANNQYLVWCKKVADTMYPGGKYKKIR